MNKRLAFIMVNHNGGEETLESAKSLQADLTNDDIIILVDNGSSDGSGEKVKNDLENVVRITSDENRTFAGANNLGIKYALNNEFKYIGIINPDVRIKPGMIDKLIRRLDKDQGNLAVSPLMYYEEPAGKVWFGGGKINWCIGWLSHKGLFDYKSDQKNFDGITDYLTGCCWLTTQAVWEDVGLLSTIYGMYAEDADWSLRARQLGINLEIVADAELIHRVSQSSGGGRSKLKMIYRTKASRLFFRKFTPAWLRPLQIILRYFANSAYFIFLLRRGEKYAAYTFLRSTIEPIGCRLQWPPQL